MMRGRDQTDAKGAERPCCLQIFGNLVEPDGIEPSTSAVRLLRSPN
jgi:hypothetical protein